MIKARDLAAGRRLRHATKDAKLQRRAVIETGRAMFRSMPPVVRLRILGRLKKLTADAEAEITHAPDHAHLRAGMMKLMTLTAMIDAARGQTPGQQRSPVRSRDTFVALQGGRRMTASGSVTSALLQSTDIGSSAGYIR